MSTQNYFVLNSIQGAEAVSLSSELATVVPIPINSLTPGQGININELADGYDVGDPIVLLDQFVIPYRVVNDTVYQTEVPDLVEFLLEMPAALLESETIFVPVEA